MNKFSFTDFLYRKSYPNSSGSRGVFEVEAMSEATRKRKIPFEFDNGFSMRALTAQGPDTEGGFTVEDDILDDRIFDNFYQTSYFLSNATILGQPQSEYIRHFKV